MPITLGPKIEDGLYNVLTGLVYFETVVTDPAAAKAGESVTTHSTARAGAISIETKAPAPPKTGATVSDYRVDLLMEILGELG